MWITIIYVGDAHQPINYRYITFSFEILPLVISLSIANSRISRREIKRYACELPLYMRCCQSTEKTLVLNDCLSIFFYRDNKTKNKVWKEGREWNENRRERQSYSVYYWRLPWLSLHIKATFLVFTKGSRSQIVYSPLHIVQDSRKWTGKIGSRISTSGRNIKHL